MVTRLFFKISTICIAILCFAQCGSTTALADVVIDFSDKSLAANTFYNGGPTTNTSGWSSGTVQFGNSYNSNFGGFWNGFSYSNVNNPTNPSFVNQYAAITGTGVGGSGNYALGYAGSSAYFNLPDDYRISSVSLTNTTYAYHSMRDGDGFAKKFGVGDFYRVTFTGYDQIQSNGAAAGNSTGSVTFSLADFTSTDNSQHYILNTWSSVNLTSLGLAKAFRLSFSSSDVGLFGINTPTYLAFDNLVITAVPEPGSFGLITVAILACGLRRRKAAK